MDDAFQAIPANHDIINALNQSLNVSVTQLELESSKQIANIVQYEGTVNAGTWNPATYAVVCDSVTPWSYQPK